MKLNIKGGGHITIDDNSKEAKAIMDGADFDFIDGKIITKKNTSDEIKNKWHAIKKLKDATTWEEGQKVLIKILKNII